MYLLALETQYEGKSRITPWSGEFFPSYPPDYIHNIYLMATTYNL
jgi:hypothetical protein